MHIDYAVVKHPHPHTTNGCLARRENADGSPGSYFFWIFDEPHPSDYAVLAHNRAGKLVGIQKFHFSIGESTRTLEAIATYVWPLYQREGIGAAMWATALETLSVTHVKVVAISDKGKTLVETMRSRYPTV
jgi:GNAT superfamily N-acetyltransferase